LISFISGIAAAFSGPEAQKPTYGVLTIDYPARILQRLIGGGEGLPMRRDPGADPRADAARNEDWPTDALEKDSTASMAGQQPL